MQNLIIPTYVRILALLLPSTALQATAQTPKTTSLEVNIEGFSIKTTLPSKKSSEQSKTEAQEGKGLKLQLDVTSKQQKLRLFHENKGVQEKISPIMLHFEVKPTWDKDDPYTITWQSKNSQSSSTVCKVSFERDELLEVSKVLQLHIPDPNKIPSKPRKSLIDTPLVIQHKHTYNLLQVGTCILVAIVCLLVVVNLLRPTKGNKGMAKSPRKPTQSNARST